jgi:hypothetical protein
MISTLTTPSRVLFGLATAIAMSVTFGAASASAETITYTADLKGSTEVPANTTGGTGSVTATIDTATKQLTYTATYSGLTGPGIAAHFHGPAAAGTNAPPIIPVKGSVASPIKGEATLTDDQIGMFADGKMYFNVHTDANKGGEIRGQLMKK